MDRGTQVFIPCDICSPTQETYIPSDMCFPTTKHISLAILCSPTQETHFTSNMLFTYTMRFQPLNFI